MFGSSCSPRLSAQPFTQMPRRARRFHVSIPLAQTICADSTDQSFGKASAFAIHSAAGRSELPLPLREGWGEGVTRGGDTDALTLALSQKERDETSSEIGSRLNQSASDDLSGHNCALGIFGGRAFAVLSEQPSSTWPSSVTPRRKVISPNGLRKTLTPIF